MSEKEPVLIGVDLGTSGCIAVAISLDGRLIARTETPYDVINPQPGWAEQRAEDWLQATGFSVRWFMDNFGLAGHTADDFRHFEKLAQEADIGSNGLFFYPHLWGARAPRFNPVATGVFFGITHTHRTAQFCRAILEGAAYQYLAVLDLLASLGVTTTRLTMVGGETRNRLWNQIKADVVGHEILIPEIQDGSPLGAAMLAGLATGADAADAVKRVIRWKECVQPIDAHTQQYRCLYQKCSAIYDIIEAAYSIV